MQYPPRVQDSCIALIRTRAGLLVIAKNEFALNFLARQFSDHTISRTYVALVWGDFKENEGTVTGHIGRSVKKSQGHGRVSRR